MQDLQTVIELKASSEVVAAGTTAGAGISLRRPFGHATALLDVTAVGDGAEAADTLDVYLDASLDGGTTWLNVGRFARVTGVDGAYATGTLTLSGVITPGSHAESVLTSTGVVPVDGTTVTIGSTVYTFKTTLTGAAFEVLIGNVADAAEALDNLKSAINASAGAGTTYGTGTTAHPSVVATTNTDTTQKVIARVPGTAANTLATTNTGVLLSWPAVTLGDGTGASNPGVAAQTVTIGSTVYSFLDVLSETNGAAAIVNQVLFGADSAAALDNLKLAINAGATEGTNYSTGTTAHPTVSATTNTDTTQVVQSLTHATSNNSVATTETLANGAWGGATLSGATLGAGVAAQQTLTWSDALVSTQPIDTTADLSSTSGGIRQMGLLTMLRYRSIITGSLPDFTFSVKVACKP